ncbi:MAG: PKD domain-containing protein [Myxococcota bacterium]|nr:PKD domain-containing protein [Myxococcota bacterium]
MLRDKIIFALALASLLSFAEPARAADILFVSDSGGDSGIATVLTAEGHTVTTRSGDYAGGNMALLEDLSAYDAVFWSASGSGSGSTHSNAAVFTNLSTYVMDGGRVYVTGYDSIASPTDPLLIAFVGGTGSVDGPGSLSAVIAGENSLNSGVVDIRGVVPSGGSGDLDGVTGLTSGTIAVVAGSSGSAWTLRTLGSGEIAYVSNGDSGTGSAASWGITSAGGAGAYNASLRNFSHAAEGASREPGAPIIEFTSPSSADEGAEVVITVSVTDEEGDPATWSWDLDDDGVFGDMAGVTSYTIPAGTSDGDGSVRVAVEATDGTNTSTRTRTVRIANVEPRITSSPPTETSVGANLRYAIVVDDPGGANDAPRYTVVRGPASATITDAGTFTWMPTELDVTRPAERVTIEISVDDGDGGIAMQSWEMSVSPNRTPEGLLLVYPASGIVIADPLPRLVVGNGTDADPLDTLVYYFELDDDADLTEPLLVESGMVEQGVGYTAFQLTTPLAPGTYHWRAWMSDGFVTTEPLTTTFTVVPDPRQADGGPATGDGSMEIADAGTDRMGPPPASSGCSAAAGSRSAPTALALFALGLAVIAGYRRRR